MWAPNCAEWMLAALGLLRAGGVLVPMNTRFKGGEAAYILRDAGVYDTRDGPRLPGPRFPGPTGRPGHRRPGPHRASARPGRGRRGRRRRGADHEAGCVPSGRRGRPSGRVGGAGRRGAARRCLGSHLHFGHHRTPQGRFGDARASLRTFGTWSSIVRLTAGDRYLVVNPFFHTFGYKAGILACLMAGATVVPGAGVRPSAVMTRIGAERISVLPGPPTLYQTLLSDPRRAEQDLSSLRLGGHRARPWYRSSWSR